MTAEVAVMNKSAVALAADSAVTSPSGGIFNSANKLFTLSKFRPVGVMVYGAARFMGIPWQTIVKLYREQLEEEKFDHVEEYSDDFCDYLKALITGDLVPHSHLQDYLYQHARSLSIRMLELASQEVYEEVQRDVFQAAESDEGGEPDFGGMAEKFNRVLEEYLENTREEEAIAEVSARDVSDSIDSLEEAVQEGIEQLCENFPFQIKQQNLDSALFRQVVAVELSRHWWKQSGVVIAGYGQEDLFPVLDDIAMEAVYNGKLKYARKRCERGTSNVYPFAQSGVVEGLIRGVAPDFKAAVQKYMLDSFEGIADDVEQVLTENLNLTSDQRQGLSEDLRDLMAKRMRRSRDTLRQFEEVSRRQVKDNLDNLPKDELAATAETFVNTTSFMKKVQKNEDETVGGPTDVALISKGDGFVWVERKHYFDPELNHHFFENYFDFSPPSSLISSRDDD